ncbi:MAG: NADH-quinone oxidoreductase subunit C [Elusimicrobia bacterium]|nr:NADH-quinone oxidoreductase subunit C [Elusimicrobiota bacterium]
MAETRVSCARLAQAARRLRDEGPCRLATVVATDDRSAEAAFVVRYVFACPGRFETISAAVPIPGACCPSLAQLFPVAALFERELREFFGVRFEGHPDPRRLLLHELWPEGAFPLRKDFKPEAAAALPAAPPYAFVPVEGEGVFEIPVGPVHAGIIEPGHFRFSVAGEPIIRLEARLGYVHRGIEKLAEGARAPQGLRLAERVSGDNAFAHSLAYCQAWERLAGVEVPRRAAVLRVVGSELERMHCHLADIAGIATDVGFPFGAMQALRLRELVLRRAAAWCGDRFLKGINAPGGVRCDLDAVRARELASFVKESARGFAELKRLLGETDSLMDRVEGTGELPRRVAEDLGGVGPAARASGVDLDLRRDLPYAAYADIPIPVAVRPEGDVGARMAVKFEEFERSADAVVRALGALSEGPCGGPIPEGAPGAEGMGWAESPRGEVLYWLRMGPEGTIARLKIKDPSFVNWPLLPWAVRGDIVPDFPLVNKSFNLSYAGNDR